MNTFYYTISMYYIRMFLLVALMAVTLCCSSSVEQDTMLKVEAEPAATAPQPPTEELSISSQQYHPDETSSLNVAASHVANPTTEDNVLSQATKETSPTPEADKPKAPPLEQQIIKNAQLRMQVEKLTEATAVIKKQVKTHNGYLASANEDQTNESHAVTFSIRVPAAQFEPLVDEILRQATFVAQNQTTAEDVTEEFVDIQSRLKTKYAMEKRYLDLLKQARTMKEILELEHALQVIREEIESKEGRLKYLRNQVGYSTIALTMYEDVPYTASPETGFWRELTAGFGEGWQAFLTIIVSIITLWPLWLFLVLAVWLIRKWLRKRPLPPTPDKTLPSETV